MKKATSFTKLCLIVYNSYSSSNFMICEDTSNVHTYCQIDDIAVVTSIDNNDELELLLCQSLPRANSVEALRGCRADGQRGREENTSEVSLVLSLFDLVTTRRDEK